MSQEYAKYQPAGFDNHIKNIAIVGATGSVGGYITQYLLKTGKHNVTAITRANRKSTMPDGVKAAKVDYEDESTLVDALKGQQALIITMKTGPAGKEASLKLIRAAAKANVGWIMPNEYSPDVVARPDMGNESLLLPNVAACREEIKNLNVSSFIGLFCSYWYEFSLAQSPSCYGFDLKNKAVTFIDDGNTKINTSTWEQCGRAVANLFSLPILPQDQSDKGLTLSHWRNDAVHIDSFFLNQKDMFDSILRVTGEKESDWDIQYQNAQERYKQGQEWMKEGGAKLGAGFQQCMYTRVFYNDGSGDFSDRLDNERLSLPTESLDEATKRAFNLVKSGYTYFTR